MPSERTGSDSSAPYFFLSYAHVPPDDSDDSDPHLWVHKFFRDLCTDIRNIANVRGGAAGFMDRSIRAGEIWTSELAQSLHGCRVFVPLYSPRYFNSPWCGKEWTVFSDRRAQFRDAAENGVPSAVVPAIWYPVPDRDLPHAVREMQYSHPELGHRYQTLGLYSLVKLSAFRRDYQRAVLQLARRIVEVAGTVEVDRGDGDPDALEAARDAFVAPPATRSSVRRTLRISVAAGSRNRPPEGRSPDCYGSSPLAWTPYRPDADQPLVKAAEQVAERMKFRAVVDEFDPRSGQPDAPEILLLDRWVLRDAGQRAQLTKFDADTTRPAGLAVPWNDGDPDSIGVRRELAAEVDAVLPLRTSRQRQAGLGAALEIPDHRTFDTLLPKVVAWASKEYLRHATASPPPGRGTERFRVGDTDGAAGRPTDHRRNDEEEDRDGQP